MIYHPETETNVANTHSWITQHPPGDNISLGGETQLQFGFIDPQMKGYNIPSYSNELMYANNKSTSGGVDTSRVRESSTLTSNSQRMNMRGWDLLCLSAVSLYSLTCVCLGGEQPRKKEHHNQYASINLDDINVCKEIIQNFLRKDAMQKDVVESQKFIVFLMSFYEFHLNKMKVIIYEKDKELKVRYAGFA
jgi:hypothetical protein